MFAYKDSRILAHPRNLRTVPPAEIHIWKQNAFCVALDYEHRPNIVRPIVLGNTKTFVKFGTKFDMNLDSGRKDRENFFGF